MKHKLIAKTLTLTTLLGASTCTLASVSCSPKYEKSFFSIHGKDLDVTFCDRGASIYSIKYKDTYITYHPKDKDVFLKDDFYYGKVLGRVAGRIANGELTFKDKEDDTVKEYKLEINETAGAKNNTLHGGFNSLTPKDWTREIEETADAYNVTFTCTSPDGEAGFPGKLSAKYVYTISKNENVIDLNITATATKATPINLGTHPYFRLGNDGDILKHTLQIPAKEMGKFNFEAGTQIIEGEQSVETGKGFEEWNFLEPKEIGKDIKSAEARDPVSGGYDHVWKFNESTEKLHTVTLSNPANGLSLEVSTDATGVILYANCFPKENQEMNPKGKDTRYAGITIEPFTYFGRKSIDNIIVYPNETFTREIHYKITG